MSMSVACCCVFSLFIQYPSHAIVISQAYERSCQVYNYECTPGAPYYITIGDGGNKEGLATGWIEPQPTWSAYRQASYGFGELRVSNSTHMHWSWHQNEDLVPTVADEFTLVKSNGEKKGYLGLRGQKEEPPVSVTAHPVFVKSQRGIAAAEFNEAALGEAMQH